MTLMEIAPWIALVITAGICLHKHRECKGYELALDTTMSVAPDSTFDPKTVFEDTDMSAGSG